MKVAKREKQEEFEKVDLIGMEAFKILKVNPTRKELNLLYEKEDSDNDEEINYVDEKDGEDRVKIVIYLAGETSGKIRSVRFFITDKERMNKDGDKTQYLNQVCQSTWVDDEGNLPEWFLNFQDKDKNFTGSKSYRKALEGEADFYEFLRNIMSGVNFYSEDTDIHFEFKKMLKGNFSQLNQYLCDEELVGTFSLLSFVKNDIESGKTYNELFTKAVMPTGLMNRMFTLQEPYYKGALAILKEDDRFKDNLTLSVNDIYGYVDNTKVTFKKDYDKKAYERFLKIVEDEYGCKGFYRICPLFEYSADMDIASSNVAVISAEDSSY